MAASATKAVSVPESARSFAGAIDCASGYPLICHVVQRAEALLQVSDESARPLRNEAVRRQNGVEGNVLAAPIGKESRQASRGDGLNCFQPSPVGDAAPGGGFLPGQQPSWSNTSEAVTSMAISVVGCDVRCGRKGGAPWKSCNQLRWPPVWPGPAVCASMP